MNLTWNEIPFKAGRVPTKNVTDTQKNPPLGLFFKYKVQTLSKNQNMMENCVHFHISIFFKSTFIENGFRTNCLIDFSFKFVYFFTSIGVPAHQIHKNRISDN